MQCPQCPQGQLSCPQEREFLQVCSLLSPLTSGRAPGSDGSERKSCRASTGQPMPSASGPQRLGLQGDLPLTHALPQPEGGPSPPRWAHLRGPCIWGILFGFVLFSVVWGQSGQSLQGPAGADQQRLWLQLGGGVLAWGRAGPTTSAWKEQNHGCLRALQSGCE